MAKLFRLRDLMNKYPKLDRFRIRLLAWICDDGTKFFDRTYRRIHVRSQAAREYLDANKRKPVIFALYHGHMIAALGLNPRRKLTILISDSRDGEIIARACVGLGFSIARGSPSHGAVKGSLEMIEAAESGQSLGFMVDGPRGPIHSVKPGIIRLAEITGLPIIPIAVASRHYAHMGSWDDFQASSWGTPMVCMYGDPIFVDRNTPAGTREELRAQLEETMKDLNASANKLLTCTATF